MVVSFKRIQQARKDGNMSITLEEMSKKTGMTSVRLLQLNKLGIKLDNDGKEDFKQQNIDDEAAKWVLSHGKQKAADRLANDLKEMSENRAGELKKKDEGKAFFTESDLAYVLQLLLSVMDIPEITVTNRGSCGSADDIIRVSGNDLHKMRSKYCTIGGVLEGQQGRKKFDGPMIPGPWFWINEMATVMSVRRDMGTHADINRAKEAGKFHRAYLGGYLLINGTLHKIKLANTWSYDLTLQEVMANE